MRALLLFNPHATTTDDRVRDVIASALASATTLDVQPTKQRGHATHLVAGAIHDGVEVVFALGGDGTANEVIQAVAGTGIRLGVIPGGGANVFARALGLPNDPVATTSVLLDHLRHNRSRAITLGRAAGRYFGFNAGFGFDAAVIRRVEQHDHVKRAIRQLAFVWAAGHEWFTGAGRQAHAVTLTLPDGTEVGPVTISLVANADPYTYLGPRPLRVLPQASFDAGLSVLGVERISTPRLLRVIAAAFSSQGLVEAPAGVRIFDDLPAFTLSSPYPQPLMVDGDYAGEHLEVTFEAVPQALHVLS